VYPTIKTKDGRKLKVKVLIDSGCTNTPIARKTVEEKGIPTKSLPKLFNVYNSDESRNGEKTIREFVCLEINSNGHIVTNFIRPYLHQFSINSHSLNGYRKPLKRPFDRYQSRLEAINNGRDIRQINW